MVVVDALEFDGVLRFSFHPIRAPVHRRTTDKCSLKSLSVGLASGVVANDGIVMDVVAFVWSTFADSSDR